MGWSVRDLRTIELLQAKQNFLRGRKRFPKLTQMMSQFARIITTCCFTEYLLLITDHTVSSGLKSYCEAPNVIEGHDGRIVCTFEVDISEHLQDLEVHHFSDIILNCKSHDGNIVSCYTRDGYQYEREASNKFTIKIPKVNKDKAGQYRCYVAPSEPEEVHPCNLNVTDFEEMASTSTNYTLYINLTSSMGQEGSVYSRYLYTIPIVLGSTLLILTLMFLFLILLTRFTHKLTSWIKIRSTDIFYSESTQDNSRTELEETEACL